VFAGFDPVAFELTSVFY